MTLWRKVFLLAVGLPILAAAADLDMMNLIMPDVRMVMEINFAKIMASPIGLAMADAVHQGIDKQLEVELAKGKPQFQDEIEALSNIDWSHEVQDIVVAGGGGPAKQPPVLVIVRSSLDAARIRALKAFTGNTTEYEGAPMLVSSKPGNGVIAFLDNSIVLIGQMADVKAAIHRRSQPAVLPPALAAQMAKYRRYDIWLASTEVPTAPLKSPAAGSPAGAKVVQFLQKLASFDGGVRLSPDFDLSANIEARTTKDAGEMAEGLQLLAGMVQSQAKSGGKGGNGQEGLTYQVNGKRVVLSLHVPEAQMRAGIEQMRTAQAAQAKHAAAPPPAPTPVPRVAASSGMAPPPPGTIRVQSSESDMGTVLIPAGKEK